MVSSACIVLNILEWGTVPYRVLVRLSRHIFEKLFFIYFKINIINIGYIQVINKSVNYKVAGLKNVLYWSCDTLTVSYALTKTTSINNIFLHYDSLILLQTLIQTIAVHLSWIPTTTDKTVFVKRFTVQNCLLDFESDWT